MKHNRGSILALKCISWQGLGKNQLVDRIMDKHQYGDIYKKSCWKLLIIKTLTSLYLFTNYTTI
jgi:hypothetical protein